MHYDEIIVGSGSTGAVIAARLSEDKNRNVLLIEAGPDYPGIDNTPASLLNGAQLPRDHDWGFSAEMVEGRSVLYPRGKVIGGSSSTNACLALRGMPEDYDEWAESGCPDWAWEKTLPVFRELESDQDIQDGYHGNNGPTPLRRYKPSELYPVTESFIKACRELGFPESADHNHPESWGVGTGPWNIDRDGNRISTAIAYLETARKRPNLSIRANCLVDKVLFDGDRAIGLSLVTERNSETVHGARITLSAGSIGSPSILLRSGIGHADELSAIDITPVSHLPGVGANLIDHAYVGFEWYTKPGVVEEGIPLLQATLRFTAHGSPLKNDMQINPFQDLPQPGVTLYAGLMKPFSRGSLKLVSKDPNVQPEICLNLASNAEDVRRLCEGLKQLDRFVRTDPLEQIGAHTLVLGTDEVVSSRRFSESLKDSAWLQRYVKETVVHYLHPVGTASMGSDSQAESVVDQHGRVYGVSHLRVADASIMPTIPRANTHLTCLMIGERVASWMATESN